MYGAGSGLRERESDSADALLPAARVLLTGISVAAGLLGVSLWIGAGRTSEFFAWTIKSPTAASALGGFYVAIAIYAALAARARRWPDMHVAFPPAIFAPAALLIPTIIHRSQFDFHHPIAWFWIALYVFYPPALLVVYIAERRRETHPLPIGSTFPLSQRLPGALAALLLSVLGLALLVHPESLAPDWPWALTPLVGRVYGCWLLAAGIGGLTLATEADWHQARIGIQAQLVLSAALVAGPLLHPGGLRPTIALAAWLLGFGLLAVDAGFLLWRHKTPPARS